MLRLAAGTRIYAATRPVSAHAGIDRLAAIVRHELGKDPLSGDLFCFFNRRRRIVKFLVWDRNGFWVLDKRLERGCFERIDQLIPWIELDRAQLAMLLAGIDTRKMEFRKHFARDVRLNRRADDGSGSARTAP